MSSESGNCLMQLFPLYVLRFIPDEQCLHTAGNVSACVLGLKHIEDRRECLCFLLLPSYDEE